MEATSGVTQRGLPQGKEAPRELWITGTSAATSSSNRRWDLSAPGHGKGSDRAPLRPAGDGSVLRDTRIRPKGSRVSGCSGAHSIGRTGRRVGSAVVCFEAVSALHRKDKRQRRAKSLAQVFSSKGESTSPAERPYGSAGELTANSAAQSFSTGGDAEKASALNVPGKQRGHDKRKKTAEGKQRPDKREPAEVRDGTARPTHAGTTEEAAGRSQDFSMQVTSGDAGASTDEIRGGVAGAVESLSLAEFAGAEEDPDLALIATATYTTTGGKLKMLRRSSSTPPSLFGMVVAVSREMADGFDALRRRAMGLFWARAPSEAGRTEGSSLDSGTTMLQLQLHDNAAELQPTINDFFGNREIGRKLQELWARASEGQGRNNVFTQDKALTLLDTPGATGEDVKFYYECVPASKSDSYDWEFEPARAQGGDQPQYTPHDEGMHINLPNSAANNGMASTLDLHSVQEARSCRIYAVKSIDSKTSVGKMNAGFLLVRTQNMASTGRALGASSSGESTESRKLFCKKMKNVRSGSECAAAKHFVEEWRENARAHGCRRCVSVGVPFCRQKLKSPLIGAGLMALCMDPMERAGDQNFVATLAIGDASDVELGGDGQHSVLWWTWESVRALTKAGLFHRDIKRDNFLVLPQAGGEAPIWIASDMGLACWTLSSNGKSRGVMRCIEAMNLGTPQYSSPDHFSRSDSAELRAGAAARGDSFSWVVMIIDDVLTQCTGLADPQDRLSAIEMLLGYCRMVQPHGTSFESAHEARVEEWSKLVEFGNVCENTCGPLGLWGEDPILYRLGTAGSDVRESKSKQGWNPFANKNQRRVAPYQQESEPRSKAGEMLFEWIKKKSSAPEHLTAKCGSIQKALVETRLKPLDHVDAAREREAVPAIDLMAQALLGNPWNLAYDKGDKLFYAWDKAKESPSGCPRSPASDLLRWLSDPRPRPLFGKW
ncbi:unnamed protein product [Amoebophrya sp. A25]|nr:unnamed protein product [Amoebophrya sp. A25]|eukprot:GSA25T00024567001.1